MKRICCGFALALGLPVVLGGQEAPALAVGTRIRLIPPTLVCNYTGAASCYSKVVGSLESIDSATIVVRRENGETVDVPHAPGTQLDVSTSRGACSRHRGGCIALGFFGGAGVGALVGWISVQAQGGAGSGTSCNENLCELVYLVTVPAGAVLGTIVGAVMGGEDWERADIPARLSVGPDGSGRFSVGLSLRF